MPKSIFILIAFLSACAKPPSPSSTRGDAAAPTGVVESSEDVQSRAAKPDAWKLSDARAKCARGDAQSCVLFGSFSYIGVYGAVDFTGAAWGYDRGCYGHAGSGCRLLAGMYLVGVGVAHDESRARALMKEACHLGDEEGCEQAKGMGL